MPTIYCIYSINSNLRCAARPYHSINRTPNNHASAVFEFNSPFSISINCWAGLLPPIPNSYFFQRVCKSWWQRPKIAGNDWAVQPPPLPQRWGIVSSPSEMKHSLYHHWPHILPVNIVKPLQNVNCLRVLLLLHRSVCLWLFPLPPHLFFFLTALMISLTSFDPVGFLLCESTYQGSRLFGMKDGTVFFRYRTEVKRS